MKPFANVLFWLAFGTAAVSSADAYDEGKDALAHSDYLIAAEEFARACDAQNPMGCFELAAMKETGLGTAQNKYSAETLYARACTLGYPKGCANLGLGYDNP